ncbi:hypothetical protein L6R50_24965 [Myxococcota bacterium]|nr:hypothetical protein [Myxococcota bacterium]
MPILPDPFRSLPLLAAVTFLLAGAAPGGVEHRDEEGRYTARFPGKPVGSSASVVVAPPRGTAGVQRTAFADGTREYFVEYYTEPTAWRRLQPDQILSAERGVFARGWSVGGGGSTKSAGAVGGSPARDTVLTLEGGLPAVVRTIRRTGGVAIRVYHVAAACRAAPCTLQDLTPFLDAFRLTPDTLTTRWSGPDVVTDLAAGPGGRVVAMTGAGLFATVAAGWSRLDGSAAGVLLEDVRMVGASLVGCGLPTADAPPRSHLVNWDGTRWSARADVGLAEVNACAVAPDGGAWFVGRADETSAGPTSGFALVHAKGGATERHTIFPEPAVAGGGPSLEDAGPPVIDDGGAVWTVTRASLDPAGTGSHGREYVVWRYDPAARRTASTTLSATYEPELRALPGGSVRAVCQRREGDDLVTELRRIRVDGPRLVAEPLPADTPALAAAELELLPGGGALAALEDGVYEWSAGAWNRVAPPPPHEAVEGGPAYQVARTETALYAASASAVYGWDGKSWWALPLAVREGSP